MAKVIVIGSSNMDMVVKADHFPAPGETVLGGEFFKNPGGKGANQAVAVARLGGKTVFVSKLGNDDLGKELIKLYKSEGIDINNIYFNETRSTGVALITVDKKGENSIVVASGANMSLSIEDIKKLEDKIDKEDIILMQLEIPTNVVEYVCIMAKEKGCKVILNPAPAPSCALSADILTNLHLITPNAKEAEIISGVVVHDWSSAQEASLKIAQKGVKNVILTLGALGALVYEQGQFTQVPAMKVEAIDTTAAGDVFNGALCVSLSSNNSLTDAAKYANRASAIAVGRMGAIPSIPYKTELV